MHRKNPTKRSWYSYRICTSEETSCRLSEVEYKQASHSYRTAYKAQEGSFVIIKPIVELEAEKNCPAQELNQRE